MRKRDTENAVVNQRYVACGNLWITIGEKKDKPTRLFLNGGKDGTCYALLEALGRMVTLCLQNGIKVDKIIDQLHHIQCPACERKKGKLSQQGKKKELREFPWSCADAVARELKEYNGGKK